MRWIAVALVLLFVAPIAASAGLYAWNNAGTNWRAADRSSAGLLPTASKHKTALVRIFSAPTVSWRGIVASHAWIVVKPEGASSYRRYDYTAWGEPIWVDRFVPDGRWFGKNPEVVFAADGEEAEAMIPRITLAIDNYAFRNHGDYRVWPGPNSNTFVAAVMNAVPEIHAVLPPTAIGKDYPTDGRWLSRAAAGKGFRLSLAGYAGLTLGWIEGLEINIFGAVVGLDVRLPALKLPGFGRIGLS